MLNDLKVIKKSSVRKNSHTKTQIHHRLIDLLLVPSVIAPKAKIKIKNYSEVHERLRRINMMDKLKNSYMWLRTFKHQLISKERHKKICIPSQWLSCTHADFKRP